MLCALIMAGGKGTRFWPLSTKEKPKQFLNLLGNRSMIQMTIDRIRDLIPIDRIFICTTKEYVKLVKEHIPDISDRNIIVEPEGRNTAPCIALSSMIIKRYYNNATMIVLPSDHLIKDNIEFINIIKKSYEFLNDYNNTILTLGIEPNRPETGYGYIKMSENIKKINGSKVIEVNEFKEKPDREIAKKYLESKKYLWNSGMFIWKVDTIIMLLERYMKSTYEALNKIVDIKDEELENYILENYSKAEPTSIDYGIMEKAKDIYVIPCNFGWDDVGNWSSLERYSIKDQENNVIKANASVYKSKNNIILSNKKIVLNNVENLIFVETDEYILISTKDSEQSIKQAQLLL